MEKAMSAAITVTVMRMDAAAIMKKVKKDAEAAAADAAAAVPPRLSWTAKMPAKT
jgi:hypothetical protein